MTEKLITDIPRIARYARHNENQDYRFRTFLKCSDISNAKLDATVQGLTDSVWKQIDCVKCANCCKVLEVVIDDKDIARLAKRLSMSSKQFEEKYIGNVEDGTKYVKSQPCVFLGSDNRCTVYEDRPQACKDFPYLHTKGFRSRTLMMISNLSICPIVFNTWQGLKEELWGPNPNQPSRLGRTKRR